MSENVNKFLQLLQKKFCRRRTNNCSRNLVSDICDTSSRNWKMPCISSVSFLKATCPCLQQLVLYFSDMFLFIISDSDCYPVLYFVKYKLKLNPGCPFLFQTVSAAPNKRGYLFDNAPIRHNNLGKKIQSLRKL